MELEDRFLSNSFVLKLLNPMRQLFEQESVGKLTLFADGKDKKVRCKQNSY